MISFYLIKTDLVQSFWSFFTKYGGGGDPPDLIIVYLRLYSTLTYLANDRVFNFEHQTSFHSMFFLEFLYIVEGWGAPDIRLTQGLL